MKKEREALDAVEASLAESQRKATLDAVEALRGVLGDSADRPPEATDALVRQLFHVARAARKAGRPWATRSLLAEVLLAVVNDPFRARLHPDTIVLRPGALAALRAEAAWIAGLAAPPPPPVETETETEAEAESPCALTANRELAETARRVAVLLPPGDLPDDLRAHLADETAAIRTAGDLLWILPRGIAHPAEALAFDREQSPLVRLAAAIRLGVDDVEAGEPPRPAVFAVLEEVVVAEEVNWNQRWAPPGLFADPADRLAFGLLAPEAAASLSAEHSGRFEALVRTLLAGLEVLPDIRRQRAKLASALVALTFGERRASWPRGFVARLTPPALELGALERDVLVTIATQVSVLQWRYDVHHALFEIGFPAGHATLRRYLGLDPPGLLEAPITLDAASGGGSLPLGLVAQRVLSGAIGIEAAASAIATSLPRTTLAELVSRRFRGEDYQLHCHGAFASDTSREARVFELKLAALSCGGPAVVPELVVIADRELEAVFDGAQSHNTLFLALARLSPAETPIPARFDEMMARSLTEYSGSESAARELLAHLPVDRRDRLIIHARTSVPFGPTPDYSDLLSPAMRADVAFAQGPAKIAKPLAELGELIQGMMTSIRTELSGD